MNKFEFKIIHQDKKSHARVGEIVTPHGVIQTPAFVPVGTQSTVKSLTPDELKNLQVELFFVNTYHAYLRPGIDVIKKFGGLHKFMNWQGPIITDSGGFQVFSLGGKKRGPNLPNTGLTCSTEHKDNQNQFLKNDRQSLVKISDDGVLFQSHWDGSKHEFTPEKSMELQMSLGSDIHIAFDDCTFYPATREQAVKSLERTHKWAVRSLIAHQNQRSKFKDQSKKNTSNYQALYGVVQGSIYKDLRIKSAKFISNMDFDGIAIGGVSVGESKKEMRLVCDWVVPELPKNKPRHLLGVGEIDDIFDIIKRGIDTFDCVGATRLARMGRIFVKNTSNKQFEIDITNAKYAKNTEPLESECRCYTCQNFSKGYLHHLFKVRELLAYRLATIHNLHFVINLVKNIRDSIIKDQFLQFKEDFFKI